MKIKLKKILSKLLIGASMMLISTPYITQPIEVNAETTLSRPNLQISASGKVDVIDENTGKVKTKSENVNEFIEKYRVIIAGVTGIGTVSMILFFIINFTGLGMHSANPMLRQQKINGLIISGIAAAGLGAVTFIVGIFYNAI